MSDAKTLDESRAVSLGSMRARIEPLPPIQVEGGKIYRSVLIHEGATQSLSEVFVPHAMEASSEQEESQSLASINFNHQDIRLFYLKSQREVTFQVGNSCRSIPLKEAMELARWIISKS